MNKKILVSIAVLAVAAMAVSGTIAYFSDKEISLDNMFTAGSIDLKVGDSKIIVNGPTGATTEWLPTDLTNQKFFDLSDIKPGDNGHDTIKIKVDSNPAWVCGEISNIRSTEETLTNPESKLTPPDTMEKGEIDEQLYIKFFKDGNCDGIQDEGDATLKDWTLFANVGKFAIADSGIANSAFQPGIETCVTKTWCFGTPSANGCDGSSVNNKSQTDKLLADIALEAIQTRHNENFVCNPVVCSEGMTSCNNQCVNLQTDPTNCGSCGHNCTVGPTGQPITGSTCSAGQCVGFGSPE